MEKMLSNILENVSGLYMRYGIRSVTMDDVSKECGISKKTLYQHFQDKDDLVMQAILFLFNSPEHSLARYYNNGMDAIDQLLAIRGHVISVLKMNNCKMEYDLRKYHPLVYKRLMQLKHERIYQNVRDNLDKGISEGLYRKNVNIDVIARLHVGRILYVLNSGNGIFSEEDVHSPELFDEIIEYHVRGISTPAGLEKFEKEFSKLKNND